MGLPYTYRHHNAPEGTKVLVRVMLENSFERYIVRHQNEWKIESETLSAPDATISIDADTSWKLFTKAITPDAALGRVDFSGNKDLAITSLNLVAVMA